MDTSVQICIDCGSTADCIEGLCQECALKQGNELSDELLRNTILQVHQSHSWMLACIKHVEDEMNAGNYSDELTHANAVQEALDLEVDLILEEVNNGKEKET